MCVSMLIPSRASQWIVHRLQGAELTLTANCQTYKRWDLQMKKLPMCVAAIIFTHFALKIVRKLKHPEQVTKEETYRAMRDAREQWLREHQPKHPVAEVDARLMRSDPSAALSSIAQANINLMGVCKCQH